jgi:hypothetical protein
MTLEENILPAGPFIADLWAFLRSDSSFAWLQPQ